MKYSVNHRFVSVCIGIVSACLTSVFSYQLFRLGQTRGFNLDEFAYLNWAYHMYAGSTPYRDFFMFVTPGYPFTLSFLFMWFDGVTPVLLARALGTVFYIGMGVATTVLTWQIRRSAVALLVLPLFLALPLPSENLLEIRPDNLGTCIAVLGVVFQLRYFRRQGNPALFAAGLLYSVSVLILQKSAPFLLVGSAVLLGYELVFRHHGRFVRVSVGHAFRTIRPYVLGVLLPWVVFAGWSVMTTDPGRVWYSVTTMVFESNKISSIYLNLPFFYFTRNPFYYGNGVLGWAVNTVLWMGAPVIAIGMTALALRRRYGVPSAGILLVGAVFLTQLFLYVFWTPLKHPQYLIPTAPFVALFWGLATERLWRFVGKWKAGRIGFLLAVLGLSVVLGTTFRAVNTPKYSRPNTDQLAQMRQIWSFIPKSTHLLDLEGRTIYYPYPYYVCCLSFMEFGKYLSRPLPPLIESLERYKPAYIYQERFNKIGALSAEDQQYITEHYVPEWGGELWRRVR